MEENTYIILVLIVSTIVIFFPARKAKGARKNASKSELNSRDRYAVADEILEEFYINTLVVKKYSKRTGSNSISQNKYQNRDNQTFCKKGTKVDVLMKNHSA